MAVNRQLAVAAAALAIIGGGVTIWLLGPSQQAAPTDRLLGKLDGFSVFARQSGPDSQTLVIRKGSKDAWTGPEGEFVRVELFSTDMDVAGGPKPDIVAYAWTGGASCCLTYAVFSTENGGTLLGTIPNQGGDTISFVRSAARGFPPAVLPTYDLASSHAYGSGAGSPLARVLIAHDGKRFGLDLARMKAPAPDAPPAYMNKDRALMTVLAQDALEDDFVPQGAGPVDAAYKAWLDNLTAAARDDELLDATNDETFVTPALLLNEYVYKGQAAAGVAAMEAMYADRPGLSAAIFAKYFGVLAESQWRDDLDRLNGGALKPMITARTTGR